MLTEPSDPGVQLVEVLCPDDVRAGEFITAQTAEGMLFQVMVPAGVEPGSTFQVALQLREPAGTPSDRADSMARFLDDWLAPARMEPQDAAALKAILLSLEEFDALDDFVDEYCEQFADWSATGEQNLGWTALHAQYVVLLEGHIQEHLCEHGATIEEFITCVQSGTALDDPRADKFVQRLLAYGEYPAFCQLMHSRESEKRALQRFEERALQVQLAMTALDENRGLD